MHSDIIFVIISSLISLILFCIASHHLDVYKSLTASSSKQEKKHTLTTAVIWGTAGFFFLLVTCLILFLN